MGGLCPDHPHPPVLTHTWGQQFFFYCRSPRKNSGKIMRDSRKGVGVFHGIALSKKKFWRKNEFLNVALYLYKKVTFK